MLVCILFQKCRTVESDGKAIKLAIVSISCELCAEYAKVQQPDS